MIKFIDSSYYSRSKIDSDFNKFYFYSLLVLYRNIRLERYIFVYSYLVRLILKKLEKKREIAYLSLSIKRLYNVKVSKLRILSDS